ncbi:hypothetical protein WR25_01903 [Diploscapter pachys]|uniref:Uncharacterized protein n=1 Tax=Diploscapter pachys TaxID=2018661 RepID=A0A2A2KYA4_9BILA|nr:hypothetical protein WR25_01903 [Diploscapter pachys]
MPYLVGVGEAQEETAVRDCKHRLGEGRECVRKEGGGPARASLRGSPSQLPGSCLVRVLPTRVLLSFTHISFIPFGCLQDHDTSRYVIYSCLYTAKSAQNCRI